MTSTQLNFGGHTALVPVLIATLVTMWTCTGSKVIVAEGRRTFLTEAITVPRGGTVEVVNDQGTALHHPYIDDPMFSFDAGDQDPGSKAEVTFDKVGTFALLCGIHPRMRLLVTVRP